MPANQFLNSYFHAWISCQRKYDDALHGTRDVENTWKDFCEVVCGKASRTLCVRLLHSLYGFLQNMCIIESKYAMLYTVFELFLCESKLHDVETRERSKSCLYSVLGELLVCHYLTVKGLTLRMCLFLLHKTSFSCWACTQVAVIVFQYFVPSLRPVVLKERMIFIYLILHPNVSVLFFVSSAIFPVRMSIRIDDLMAGAE